MENLYPFNVEFSFEYSRLKVNLHKSLTYSHEPKQKSPDSNFSAAFKESRFCCV